METLISCVLVTWGFKGGQKATRKRENKRVFGSHIYILFVTSNEVLVGPFIFCENKVPLYQILSLRNMVEKAA